MGTFDIKDAGFNIGVNVKITKRDRKTGRILDERKGHNRCLKQQLIGITKFLNGEFNDTNYLVSYDWIPRYLGVGTNIATTTYEGVTTEVSINDTKLLNEVSPRLLLPERNTLINRATQSYVQLAINTYLPEGWYVGETIAEAGLFAGETGNNCLFRIVFDGIPVTVDSVIEVSWVISIISVDSGNTAYHETNKDDLILAIEQLLDTFATKYPDLDQACKDLRDVGIYEYARSNSTQASIDNATAVITKDITDLTQTQTVTE